MLRRWGSAKNGPLGPLSAVALDGQVVIVALQFQRPRTAAGRLRAELGLLIYDDDLLAAVMRQR